ncbi:fused MFS/spermidine synthase, partial [Streptomyces spiralis]
MGRSRNPRRERGAAEAVVEQVDGGLAELIPDRERARGWTLLIDGAPQSYVDLDDPAYLSFEYQRRLGHVIDLAAPAGKPIHAVHLGGGAFTLARYVAATRPRSTQQIVERDAALVQLVRRALPLDAGARIRVRSVDARAGLAKVPDGWADLIVADVFSGARTPAHLTSTEFLDEVRRALKPGGLYAANLADGPPLAHVRGQIATAAARFGELALVADPTVLRGKRFGNAVLVAGPAVLRPGD